MTDRPRDIIPFLVETGVFEEDPDGLLWLSAKMKDVTAKLERSEKFLSQLRKIETPIERRMERWITIYLAFTDGARKEETVKAVSALMGWWEGAMERQLDEWSMKLRLS